VRASRSAPGERRRRIPALAGLLVLAAARLAAAQADGPVEILPPELVQQLDPAIEHTLTLTPAGDVARFMVPDAAWEEAAPPILMDLDRDGTRDFVVLLLVDPGATRRALIIHEWGEAPDAFGKAVFYLIVGAEGRVIEWAGTHRVAPRSAAGEPAPSPAAPPAPPCPSHP
jgi:hypothetical protein